LAGAAFAELSQDDSAFFVQGHLQHEHLRLANQDVHWLNGSWESGFRQGAWQWSLWLADAHTTSAYADSTTNLALKHQQPEVGFSLAWQQSSQQGCMRLGFSNAQDWHTFAQWDYQLHEHWKVGFAGSLLQLHLGSALISDSAFPTETPQIQSVWSTQQWSTAIRTQIFPNNWQIHSQLAFGGSSPRNSDEHYAWQDSSLWGQVSASVQSSWQGLHLLTEGLTQSGNLRIQGIRQSNGDQKLLALAHTGYDYNNLQGTFASSQLHAQDPTLQAPWLRLGLPHQTLRDSIPLMRLGISWLHISLFEPNSNNREFSLWGNRIFDPDLQGLLGYSFAKSNWSYWGKGTLRCSRWQGYYPWHWKYFSPWVAVEISHWQGHIEGSETQYSSSLFSSTAETHPFNEWFDAFLGEAAIGFQYRGLSLSVSQWTPLSLQSSLQELAAHKSINYSLGNGLQLRLDYHKTLKMAG